MRPGGPRTGACLPPGRDVRWAAAKEAGGRHPWQVVLWGRPVDLMSYVAWVLCSLFDYSREEAARLVLLVRREGRAVVSAGPLEKAEPDCCRLHHHGLTATLERRP